ncbi:MAG: universal stress protein [Halorhodospira sp.]
MPMNRILVATDLSERGEGAAQRALTLAGEHGAELRITHVIEADLEEATLEHLFRGQGKGAREAAEELVQASEAQIRAQMHRAGADEETAYTIHCTWGSPHTGIAAEAEAWQADLVVIGLHGWQGIRDLFLGATVERLAHELSTPILVAKAVGTPPYRRVLVPVDGSQRSRRAVSEAVRLAPQATVELLQVFDSRGIVRALGTGGGSREELLRITALGRAQQEDALERFATSLEVAEHVRHREVRSGEPASAIVEVAEERGSDLVAVGTRGLSRWQGRLLGSVARRVAQGVTCDVLLRPDAEGD